MSALTSEQTRAVIGSVPWPDPGQELCRPPIHLDSWNSIIYGLSDQEKTMVLAFLAGTAPDMLERGLMQVDRAREVEARLAGARKAAAGDGGGQ